MAGWYTTGMYGSITRHLLNSAQYHAWVREFEQKKAEAKAKAKRCAARKRAYRTANDGAK